MKKLVRDLLIGTAGAYAGSKAMERVTGFIYERQSDASKQREEHLRYDPMPTTTLARKAAEFAGRKIEDDTASKVGMFLHYGFGLAGGPAAAVIRDRSGLGPFATGLAVGLGMTVSVDEGLNYVLGIVPPAPEWPAVSHVRGVAGHIAYGLTLGTALAVGDAVIGD